MTPNLFTASLPLPRKAKGFHVSKLYDICIALLCITAVPASSSAHPKTAIEALQFAKTATKKPYLALQNIETAVGMLFAGCSGDCGCDVCIQATTVGVFSTVETRIFEYILLTEHGCRKSRGGGLVIDVGANAGYFSTHAATMGCNVVALEPNPGAAALVQLNAAINHVQHRVNLYNLAVGAKNGSAVLRETEWWGQGGVQTLENTSGNGDGLQIVPLGAIVDQDAVLLKIDTEGFEDKVFEGAMQYLKTHNVPNIVVEVKIINKRKDMLKEVMQAAKLPYAYSYKEFYTARLKDITDVTGRITDITMALEADTELLCEDVWLRKEPLPKTMMAHDNDLRCV